MKISGSMVKNDLEGGSLEFHTSSGEKYTLNDLPSELNTEGYSFSVEGEPAEDMCGLGGLNGCKMFNVASVAYDE
jgi:hypothetical protein